MLAATMHTAAFYPFNTVLRAAALVDIGGCCLRQMYVDTVHMLNVTRTYELYAVPVFLYKLCIVCFVPDTKVLHCWMAVCRTAGCSVWFQI
jgi:hypothetical protein